ncbi:AEC family transporter [Gordonia hydrophobica]|uniref:AEC family transporter n=1 Tax=Gordonia hydrophobica TaxID=40516 RepID=A0ABZ2U5I2_9ACTN|nr:AEC family transporter [Gordonia hydrophobica]MBM7368697.1 putative permease [Gordonia hydrophobica]
MAQLILGAVIPIVALLAFGSFLRRRVLTDSGFWRGLEWLTYHIFTPMLFVTSISVTDLHRVSPGAVIVSIVVPILTVTAIVLLLKRPLKMTGPAISSLVQGGTRINTYLGLVFMDALYGADGVALFALAAAVMVPLVNVVAVSTLTVYGDRRVNGARPRIFREMVTNPLILGCAAGLAINLLAIPVPKPVEATLTLLAAPALVAGTLIAGAPITFALSRVDLAGIATTSILKLALLPIGAATLGGALGLSGAAYAAVVVICAVPTSPSAYVLANRLGGDSRLMASITAVQTVTAAVTLPLVLHLTSVV